MNTVASEIASAFDAMLRCRKNPEQYADWEVKHKERIEELVRDYLPSGSGFDSGTQFDFERSKPNRLVFTTEYHHMDEEGYYDGWTEHDVIVTASLALGFDLRVTGKDRNGIKEYIAETFQNDLSTVLKCYADCNLHRVAVEFCDKRAGYTELKAALWSNK